MDLRREWEIKQQEYEIYLKDKIKNERKIIKDYLYQNSIYGYVLHFRWHKVNGEEKGRFILNNTHLTPEMISHLGIPIELH